MCLLPQYLEVVQFSSVAQSCPTLCDPMNRSSPGFLVHHQLTKLAQTHVHRVSDAIQPSHLLLTPSPPAFNLSQHQGLFQGVSSLHQVAKVLELQLRISLSSEYSGLISFRIDWVVIFAVRGTLKSLLQHHSSKASVLRCSAFFIVQLSHPYMTTGKTIALIRQTFVGKVMSLLFNMLSKLVTAFLPIFPPSICHEVMGLDATILVFLMLSFKPTFSLSSFIFFKRLFSSSSISGIRVASSVYLR